MGREVFAVITNRKLDFSCGNRVSVQSLTARGENGFVKIIGNNLQGITNGHNSIVNHTDQPATDSAKNSTIKQTDNSAGPGNGIKLKEKLKLVETAIA